MIILRDMIIRRDMIILRDMIIRRDMIILRDMIIRRDMIIGRDTLIVYSIAESRQITKVSPYEEGIIAP